MMERLYNKILVLGIFVTLIGAVVIPNISGYNNKINIQSTIENPVNFPLNSDYLNAYWKSEECDGTTLYDCSGHNYDGTIYGAGWTPGCCLDFDGIDDYVVFDDYAKNFLGFNKTDDLIFSFYFKSSSTDKGIIYSSCRGGAYGYNPGFHIALNSDGTLQVQVWRLECGILMDTTGTYNDDSWHFAEIFYKGESGSPIVDVYGDGTFDSSLQKYVCSFWSDQFDYAQMGRNSNDYSDYFEGKIDEFKIIKYPGGNLQHPPIIDGPPVGVPDVEYDYTFTIADPEGDDCEINIDFNGYETGWMGPYESGEVVTVSYKWNSEGTYYIKAKSRDRWDESSWSDPFHVEIVENLPPEAPTIDGPTNGPPGELLTFVFNAVDPDGDDVRFLIDWGDGSSETTSFVHSGYDITVEHMWDYPDTFSIRVRAEDTFGNIGPETTKLIPIVKNKAINNMFLLRLLGQFAFLQKLLLLTK